MNSNTRLYVCMYSVYSIKLYVVLYVDHNVSVAYTIDEVAVQRPKLA